MSRFFVGQRVRLVKPFYPENMGKTGRIRELWEEEQVTGVDNQTVNCSVDWDNGERDDSEWDFYGNGYTTHTEQLEPILDQHQPADDAEFIRHIGKILERQGVGCV